MSGRRWNVFFWLAMVAVLAGSAASLVLWPVHRPKAPRAAAKAPAAKHAVTRAPSSPAAPVQEASRSLGPPPTGGRVKLYVYAARGESRVVVRQSTSSGTLLFDSTLARGGTLKISGPRLYARLSNVANVDVRVGSRMMDLTCTAGAGVILTRARAIPTHPPDCPKPPSGS